MRKQLLMGVMVMMVGLGCRPARQQPGMELVPSTGFVRDWQAELGLGKDSVAALHLRGQTLVVYTRNNHGYWLGTSGGQLLGTAKIGSRGHTLRPPVALADKFVIPTTATLEVFDSRGRRLDSVALDHAIQSDAVGEENVMYVGVSYPDGGRLAKIDITKIAEVEWELWTGTSLVAAPVIGGETIFAASTDGRVWAVNAARDPVWSTAWEDHTFHAEGPVTADLAADDYGVYVASKDQKLYCLERSSGKIRWVYHAGAPLLSAPIPLGPAVYQLVPGRGLASINKTAGSPSRQPTWLAPDVKQVLSADDKHLYVLSGSGLIVALDRATGQPAFRSRRSDFAVFATNTRDATIYAATKSGQVYAIKPITKPGTVGQVVRLDPRTDAPIALAR